jgi:glycerophosphoryl diester phosphodiesterase
VPTFEEIMALAQTINRMRVESVRQLSVRSGVDYAKPRPIGVYPETKHPSYFAALGLAMEVPLLDALDRWDYAGPDAPVFIQSFEVGNLMALRERTHLPLVQLIEAQGQPYDFVEKGFASTYADMVSPAGLETISTYADVIGVNKVLIIPRSAGGMLEAPTSLVANAHAAGLRVHGWTFRAENSFLPRDLRSGGYDSDLGDLATELQAYLRAGMDGFFTDHPAIALRALA